MNKEFNWEFRHITTSDIPFSPKEQRHQNARVTSIHCTGNKFNFQMHHHVHIFYPLAHRPSTERYPLAIKLSSTIVHFFSFLFSNTSSKCSAANWNINTKRPCKLAIIWESRDCQPQSRYYMMHACTTYITRLRGCLIRTRFGPALSFNILLNLCWLKY